MLTRRHFLATAAALPVAAAATGVAALPEEHLPRVVKIAVAYQPGQLVVVPQTRYLYHVTAPGQATRYAVGVGKAGLDFQGDAVIGAKKEWPTWRPTDEMLDRDPQLYTKFIEDEEYIMPGGPSNPLGARALYLFQGGRDTFYRIHGTNQPASIGRNVSNGCIRMLNDHVKYLYEQVPLGSPVTVI